MDKMSFFSKKLNKTIDIAAAPALEGATAGGNLMYGWNNYSGSWLDKGWNNFSGSWQDKGWNNFSGSWVDGGWNNYSGSWKDKGWNNFSGSWSDGSGGGGGGCFISSACVEYRQMTDDCYELQVLRQFRDNMVATDESMRDLVLDYYRKAPSIVKRIKQSENPDEIWAELYDDLVLKCVSLIEEEDFEAAKENYIQIFRDLEMKFGGSSDEMNHD